MFRSVNAWRSPLANVPVTVMFSCPVADDGSPRRVFSELRLERDRLSIFPLHLTVVHPIDQASPLHGRTEHQLSDGGAEPYVLVKAFDETASLVAHSRGSYRFDEILWGMRFKNILAKTRHGMIAIEMHDFHTVEPSK